MKIVLRPASFSDSVNLLEWKNDPIVRAYSIFSEEFIEKENHEAWLRERLKMPGLFIINVDGRDCGDVRFDFHPSSNEIEVSIRIQADCRKKE